MANPRIPQSIPAFNSYLNSSDTYLQTIDPSTGNPVYERLTLTASEAGEWHSRRVFWRDTLYPKYIDANQSTKTVKEDVAVFMKSFRLFANPLLDKMASSGAAITADGNALNFVVNRDTSPTPRGKINDVPYVQITPLGLGEVRVRVRTSEDASRASRHPLADGVEFKYVIVDNAPVVTNPVPAPGSDTGSNETRTGGTGRILLPEDCPNTVVSKKALSNLTLGSAASGKRLNCYARWVNLSNPANNGPWTQLMQTVVL